MASVDSPNPESATVSSVDSMPSMETSKGENSLESLMEKLRAKAKANRFRSWGEISKSLRLAVSDKRNVMDAQDKTYMQKVLDTLQKSIKVTSLQSMIERLESITRQQGLKFARPSSTECYINSDMFYVEILLKPSGEVLDVKIADDDPVSSPELTKVLRSGNFTEFTRHLEGLSAIYQLNADNFRQLDSEAQKKQKKKAYLALTSLEIDLSMLAQLQSSINDPSNLVHKSPVGILKPRQGGYSLKLTYFISPYDLLDLETKTSIPLTVDAVMEKGLGHSVTVCIEGSTPHKLQTVSLISVSKTAEGKSIPSFAALSNLNSTTLPASFVLKLPEPLPMATSILRKIQGVTKITDFTDTSNPQSLLSVIISSASKGQISGCGHKDLFVTLPDQVHCYSMKANSDLQGVLVSAIPFTHPTHVPQILVFLRQQMLFNIVISSCVRSGSKKDADSVLKFDVHAYSTNHIQVTFVHPLDESLAAVDMDLRDITSVKCKIHTLSSDDSLCKDEYASKVMQRCLSIPVTMRAVIKKAQGQQQQVKPSDHGDMYGVAVNDNNSVSYLSHIPNNYGNNLTNGSSFSGGDFPNLVSRMCNKSDNGVSDSVSKVSAGNKATVFQNTGTAPDIFPLKNEKKAPPEGNSFADKNMSGMKIPLLGPLFPFNNNTNAHVTYAQSKNTNTILMNMLSDVASGTPSTGSFSFLGQNISGNKVPKQRKRKITGEIRNSSSLSKSQKQKLDDVGIPGQFNIDADSTDGSNSSLNICSSGQPSINDTQVHTGLPLSHLDMARNDMKPPGYPQRSASTDSYLTHAFELHEAISNNENSRMSEGGTPSNPDLLFVSRQMKSLSHVAEDDSVDSHQEHSFSEVLSDKAGSDADQVKISPKLIKKIKKAKDDNEEQMSKPQNRHGNEDPVKERHKSGNEAIRDQRESTLVSENLAPHATVKITKSGESSKDFKASLKCKQRDGCSLVGAEGDTETSAGKKKADLKKERKRRRAESADSISKKSPVWSVNKSPSLMQPPDTSTKESVAPISENQLVRPMTLNVKSFTSVSSSSPNKSPVIIKKRSAGSGSTLNNVSKNSSSKNISSELGTKVALPVRSSTHDVQSIIGVDLSEPRTVAEISAHMSPKILNKHKQSPSGRSSSSGSDTSSRNSSSKVKSSFKLKNKQVVSPVVSSREKSPSVPVCIAESPSSPISLSTVSSFEEHSPPSTKDGCGNNKSVLRSRKGSTLSAVIDKLRAQHPVVPDREARMERKEGLKDSKGGSPVSKTGENKKFSSSDQFTVKQSSQGDLKLTVTKTKFKDSNMRTGKSKVSSLKSPVLDAVVNCCKSASMTRNSAAKVVLASKKAFLMSNDGSTTTSSKISSAIHAKPSVNSARKISPSSSILSNVSSKAVNLPNYSKSSKLVEPLTQNKAHPRAETVLNSEKKMFGGISVKNSPTTGNSDAFSGVTQGTVSSSVSVADTGQYANVNIKKRNEFAVNHCPDEKLLKEVLTNETQNEKPFQLLVDEEKTSEEKNSSRKTPVSVSESSSVVSESVNFSEAESHKVSDEDRLVSSSSDIKSALMWVTDLSKGNQESVKNTSIPLGISPNKLDSVLNASLLHEGMKKIITPFAKPMKQINQCNTHSDDDSSPEGLVIDYHDPLKSVNSPDKRSSAQLDVNSSFHMPMEKCEKTVYSPVPFQTKFSFQGSPLKSPAHIMTPPSNHSSSSLSRPSPTIIDDELMNEAVMTIGK